MDSSFAQFIGPKGRGADSSQTLHTISSYIFSYNYPRYLGAFSYFPPHCQAAELGVWIPPVLGLKPGTKKRLCRVLPIVEWQCRARKTVRWGKSIKQFALTNVCFGMDPIRRTPTTLNAMMAYSEALWIGFIFFSNGYG